MPPLPAVVALAIAALLALWLARRLLALLHIAIAVAVLASLPDLLHGRIPAWALSLWSAISPILSRLWADVAPSLQGALDAARSLLSSIHGAHP